MPPQPHRPDALTWQVFRGSTAVRQGLLTEHQLRSGAWIRLRHDVYADARLDRDHALTCRAALLRLPPGVMIAGPSAAYLHGVDHAATFTDEVHVLVPPQMRIGAQRGLRLHIGGADLAPAPGSAASGRRPRALDAIGRPGRAATATLDRQTSDAGSGLPSGRHRSAGTRPSPVVLPRTSSAVVLPRTSSAQAAWETAVWLEPVRAVGIVDTLLANGLTDQDALAAIADANVGRPGAQRARWVFGLADPAAQSPPESHLRVRLVLAGLPRPVAQHPVRLPTGLVLHPDLAWPRFRVAIEYDGHWPSDPDRLHTDRKRLNQLVAAGWLVLHVTSRRMQNDFPNVLREVRAALIARGWRR